MPALTAEGDSKFSLGLDPLVRISWDVEDKAEEKELPVERLEAKNRDNSHF